MTFLCCFKNWNKFYDLLITWTKDTKLLKFSFETEKDHSFFFPGIKICRQKDKFTKSVFRKDTFSGVYTNFNSFVALNANLATLLHRSFTLVYEFSKFHFEVETLKKTLHKNAYPTRFVEKWIAKFVNNAFVQKPVFTTVPKLELRRVLSYL